MKGAEMTVSPISTSPDPPDDHPAMAQGAADRGGVLALDEYSGGVGTGDGLTATCEVSQTCCG